MIAGSAEAVAASQHHVKDVGKILLQAQSDLRSIRETLANAGGAGSSADGAKFASAESLQAVVEKVEMELRLKAEAVLNTVVQGSVSTLPSLGAYNFSSSQPLPTSEPLPTYSTLLRRKPAPKPLPRQSRSAGDPRPDAIARPALAAVSASRHKAALKNPASELARKHMADRFGIDAPVRHEPLRPIGKAASGTLIKTRTTGALGVPSASVRHDPQAVPPIGPKDVAAGLYSLVTRGLIPPSVDLTPAMERRPAPLVQAPAKVHDFKTQFAAHNSSAYISPFGFNVSNTKLDLLSDVGTTLAEKRMMQPETYDVPPPSRPEPVDAFPDPASEKDQAARQFDELMDTFSLHHFIIRHGVTLDTTPEYASFQRKNTADWGALEQLIRALEALMQTYHVPLAYVDGQKLASLARDELAPRDPPALLECLVNAEQVRACMEVPGQRYRNGLDAETLAATEMQAGTRGMLARRRTALTRKQHGAARILTARGKVMVLVRWRRRGVEAKQGEERTRWEALVERLRVEWPRMQDAPRVIIHLASLSATVAQRRSMRDLEVRQNTQLPRLCDVREPNVDCVYVSPFALNEDVTHYFSKVLEIGGVSEPTKRYKIVLPENGARLPPNMSLASCLLYSPKALRKIVNFCRGKYAYIVPSMVGPEEQRLALALNMPLLAPSPDVAAAFGSKSGAKRIFAQAQVNAPPGLHDLYDELAISSGLAKLICAHLDVPRWVFKLDDEFGGRGHAHIDVGELECYHNLLRAHDASPHTWDDEYVQRDVREQLQRELQGLLPTHVIINARWLWRSWKEYANAFTRVGGVLEASPLQIASSPSVNVLIEPDGTVGVQSAHEQIFSTPYTFVGAAFPQTAVPFAALREASLAIGRAAHERGIVGHVGIDFVSFVDSAGHLRLWAVDLNLRLTHTAVTFGFFDFLVGGKWDPLHGRYTMGQHDKLGGVADGGPNVQPRAYVMNEMMYHPQLSQLHHSAFFNLCRLKGVSYDLQERVGTVFNLMDSFVGGVLGILTVGTSLLDALRKFADCLDFMQKQVGPAAGGKPPTMTHEATFRDVIKAIKAIVDANSLLPAPDKRYLDRSRGGSGGASPAAAPPPPPGDGFA